MRLSTPITSSVAALCAAAITAAFVPGPATGATSAPPAAASSLVQAQAQAADAGTYSSTVRGTFGRNGTVRGTFAAERFIAKNGDVFAVGVLRATLHRGDGELVGTQTKTVSVPVRSASSDGARVRCDILNLVLGPLDLNLLGLEVHLNRVVLDIVAVTGAGNLLGNLLCAVAGLLDGSALSNVQLLRLANLLNRVLNLLG